MCGEKYIKAEFAQRPIQERMFAIGAASRNAAIFFGMICNETALFFV